MLSDSFKQFISTPARTLNIIWIAFMSASFMYAGVAWFVTAGAGPQEADPGRLRTAAGAVAVLVAAASYWYRRRALGEEALRGILASPPANALSGSDALDPAEQRLAALFPYYRTTTIVVLALRESVAVLGLILAMVTGDFWLYVPFGVAAVILIGGQPPAVGSFMERALPLAHASG